MDKAMKALKLIYLLFFVSIQLIDAHCQDWHAPCYLNGGSSNIIEVDEATNRLIVTGSFSGVNESILLQGIMAYDEQNCSTVNGHQIVADEEPILPYITMMRAFANRLYVGMSQFISIQGPNYRLMEGDSISNNYIYYENGQWHNWNIPWIGPNISDNRTFCMDVIEDELWTIADKIGVNSPFKWARTTSDGITTHFELNPADNFAASQFTGRFQKIIKWNEHYYIAGSISYEGLGKVNILKWDGDSGFEVLAPAFNSSTSTIYDMAVFNDKLVVGGHFSTTLTGSPSNNIMSWDGNQWSPLFGYGVNQRVLRLKVIEDRLFFAGNFNFLHFTSGNYVASRIAIFDGTDVYRLSEASFNYGISDFAFYQEKLYVVGDVQSINLVHFGLLARFEGALPLNIVEVSAYEAPQVWPNPFYNTFNIKHTYLSDGGTLSIFNQNGTLVNSQNIAEGNGLITHPVQIDNLLSGIYFLRFVSTKDHHFSHKISCIR